MGDLVCPYPHHAECSEVFDEKLREPHASLSLFTQSCPKWPFLLFSQMKKVLKGKWEKSSKGNVLLMWKRWNKKRHNTKRHQNQWVQKLFWQWEKKFSIGVLNQMESALKVTEVQTCKNKYTSFLINKFCFFWIPPS